MRRIILIVTFTFSVKNDGGLSHTAVIEVGLLHGTAKIVWVEVGGNGSTRKGK